MEPAHATWLTTASCNCFVGGVLPRGFVSHIYHASFTLEIPDISQNHQYEVFSPQCRRCCRCIYRYNFLPSYSSSYSQGTKTYCLATASSQAVSYCPNDICYAVSVPQTTVSSGNGDVYMQISAPDTYSWVGFGYGSMMAGATIFVMYADGNGNVTVSPRSGVGHVMPKYNDQASITLLAGSGVMNGNMTANFKCKSLFFNRSPLPNSRITRYISCQVTCFYLLPKTPPFFSNRPPRI